MRVLDGLFRNPAMQALFDDRASIQGMLDFEAGLAHAEAATGVIPRNAARRIASKCRAELIDLAALSRDARRSGNLAIPLVKQLTALVAGDSVTAARYVHWGATSQDVIDTGALLQIRRAIDLLDAQVLDVGANLSKLSALHADTLMAGRTWVQQALPISFGLKTAGALSALSRHRARLMRLRSGLAVLQFGGAAGTLASLGAKGPAVAAALGAQLDLSVPALPWHAQRDRIAEAGAVLGLLAGTLGKLARDISLLMQTEVGEVLEPGGEGKGGSSTMPHKRNPVGSAVVLMAATRIPSLVSALLSAMVQEHERGFGGWHAEWEVLPEIFNLTSGALAHMAEMLAGLEVRPSRMAQNLDLTQGLLLAEAVTMELGRHIGRAAAHACIEAACRRAIDEDRHLRDVVLGDDLVRRHLPVATVHRLFDPARYLGSTRLFVRRALTEWRRATAARKSGRPNRSGKIARRSGLSGI